MVFVLAVLGVVGCSSVMQKKQGREEAPAFVAAKPVWLEGREKEMNLFVGFRATVDGKAAENAVVRLTGATVYRLFVNGEFLGYGPARGPHGYDRVDEWPLKGRCRPGRNVIAVEVAGYNANTYYTLNQPSYLQAEVVAGKRVLAHTDAAKGLAERQSSAAIAVFGARALESRAQKVQRYAFQRAFSEVYRFDPDSDAWRTDGAFKTEPLAERPQMPLLPRIAPYPAFKVLAPVREVSAGEVRFNAAKKLWSDRAIKGVGPKFLGFPENELERIPLYDVQQLETVSQTPSGKPYAAGTAYTVADKRFRTFEFARNNAGFIRATVRCKAPARAYLVFDEILSGDDVSITRYQCANVVAYELTQAGTYHLESFEPYQLKYLKLMVTGGACEFSDIGFREYVNPDADRARFDSSDETLNRIFEAARETFKQNAVDVFTDCPGRERAGWLCDSFFTGRVAADLCGNTDMERMFFQNYLLPKSFEFLPEGMLPMCYPADHNDLNYIPNWAMWFVVQLEEYLQRSGDRATVDALRPRVLALLDFFKKYENGDGLLEKLPAWVFVEWSRANRLVQDVNYPSNMTYAEVLACAARMYGIPELQAKADAVRETVRRQSFDGTWFVDNAVRQPDGSLKLSGERTETCQYYAFFFHTATPEKYSALWETLRADFGPQRQETKKHPDIHFANAFIGNYLRLELLSRQGLSAQILEETKGYFQKMEELTGTLWENDTPTASCCHGFASHVARMYYRDVLGVRRVDAVNRRVELRFAEVPLTRCSGTIPVGGGAVTVGWRKQGGEFRYTVAAPRGFKVAVDTSGLQGKAVRE
jgi:alpha-L-rhamnosidase